MNLRCLLPKKSAGKLCAFRFIQNSQFEIFILLIVLFTFSSNKQLIDLKRFKVLVCDFHLKQQMNRNKTYQKRFFKEYKIADVYIKGDLAEVFCKEFITINSNDLKAFIKELKSDVGEINQLHFLTHIQPTTIFEIPAREFYLKTLSKNFKNAEAIITENISQQFILETLLDKQKIDIPVKIFSGREEAFLWLSQISTKK